ncbi:MAG: sugar phosphate isomerase/epimerase [Oligosphaeraceae bacterium]|nr:sugar phosphate isomerase/epimerase [Oligosphaeraceae bacterium]
MLKFAVMTFMYQGWTDSAQGSHELLLETLAEAGAEGVEAFCNHFFGEKALQKLYKRKMAELKLVMPVMDLIADLAVSAGSERETAYEHMRQGIDICEYFGAEIVHLAGCHLPAQADPGEARKWIAEGIMHFIDDIEKRGMQLAFENYDPAPGLICSAAECLEIIQLTENRARFVFDTGNFQAAGERAEDNFELLFPYCVHFHFKDFKAADNPRGYTGAHFGQGFIANREIAAKMVATGYQGWLALESYPQAGNGPLETIAPELETLKSFFDRAGRNA